MLIAMLCIRFTITTSMEEDYREIGVMKAIGITSKDIQKLYVTKYVVISAGGCICGYILSYLLQRYSLRISLFIWGQQIKVFLHNVVPFIITTLLFLVVILFCRIILRKFRELQQ